MSWVSLLSCVARFTSSLAHNIFMVDHIDEMLAQFRNREEELIQTLQMMRDRNDERKHALRVNLEME